MLEFKNNILARQFKNYSWSFAVFTIIGSTYLSSSAWATNPRSHSTSNEWGSSQINALGGIGSLSDDFVDQYFSDPSLVAESKKSVQLRWLSLGVTYTKDLANTVSDFSSAFKSDSSSSAGTGVVNYLDKLRSLFGRRLGGEMNAAILATQIGNFTLIPYASGSVEGGIDVPSWPRADLVGDGYIGLGFGYAHKLPQGFTLGGNLRPGVRAYAHVQGSVSDVGGFATASAAGTGTSTSSSLNPKAGVGFYLPLDVGLGYSPLKIVRFNLVMKDFGGAGSLSKIQGDKPPAYPMRVSLGATSMLFEKGSHKINGATDLQDMLALNQQGAFWYRWQFAAQYLYHLPIRTQTSFGLNAGLQSGYPSVGVFIDLFLVKIEASTFTKESGLYIGQRPLTAYSFRAFSQLTF